MPLTRFELVTSPLPRECSTPEPQGLAFSEEKVSKKTFHILHGFMLKQNSLTLLRLFVRFFIDCQGFFFFFQKRMPMIGIEPTTYGLQNRCSTVEPHRQVNNYIIFVESAMSRVQQIFSIKFLV